MNPYTRFTTVSTLMAATVTIGAVLAFGIPAFEAISQYSGQQSGPGLMAATGASLALLVVGWLAMTEVIFPLVFRIAAVRKLVLGKYYIEGTWLQAERGVDEKRMSVIDIQPDGSRFIFSGYSLNEELEIQSNIMIEFSRFEWPFMVYKYRNSLSDGSDGRRDGVGEIQLEMNRASARRYNGFLQYVKSAERLKIEGAKLVNASEVNQLRRLEGRQQVFEKYWKLFFHRAMRPATGMIYANSSAHKPAAQSRPVHVPAQTASSDHGYSNDTYEDDMPSASFEPASASVGAKLQPMHSGQTSAPTMANGRPVERRNSSTRQTTRGDRVVPRRRASDWNMKTRAPSDESANGGPVIRVRYSGAERNGTED